MHFSQNDVFTLHGKIKNGPFWRKLNQIWPKFGHLAPRLRFFGFLTKLLETLGFAAVRASVRLYVTLFHGNRSLLFSETLQLVRACRCEKNVPSAFLIIFTVLAKNCPKWPFLAKNNRNGGFWHFFLEPRIRIS